MAATAGSGASATQYDVFLSFRGPDTRDTFTDCLYRTMDSQGIITYRDSEDLHSGDRIDDLLRAVGGSKICIPVLSRGYASSAWCLRELARATELNESTGKPAILPIFFDVTPLDVKLRTELYVKDLEKHERRHGGEIRQRWEAALRKVAEIKGWEVPGNPHGKVIDLVVTEVLRKLKVKQRPLDRKLVGVSEQVEAIMELLDADHGTGVRFVGIYGMGGIGKTTLAKIIFNELCPRFDGQCSFLDNIRESSNRYGLVNLQKQLASDIFGTRFEEELTDADAWINIMRSRAGAKKVLLVLDDLDKEEQLRKLVGGPNFFCFGSIIIITTRDKRILDQEEDMLAYEVKEMDDDKALELFSLHAFNSVTPPNSHQSLSREIVFTTRGLPLALEIIGSYLGRKREKEIWKEMLERLKKAPHDQVQDKLKISYDALRYREKEIFLDIACFFINEKKWKATYFWDACDLSPRIALEELIDLCLIKIVNGDTLWMHDQLRDLGRDIVRQECTQNLTRLSSLWNETETLEVVRSNERKDKVKALDLGGLHHYAIHIVDKELERMPNLKFLKLRAITFARDINNHLMELRWLSWDFPMIDANLHLKNLVIFELKCGTNTKNWGKWEILKMAKKLKVLSLSRCFGLERTPNFSGCLSLERLSIIACLNLQEVDSSIGKLKRLTHLDIIGCTSLQTLPEEIGVLANLEHLSIQECKKVKKLPYSIRKLALLSELDISHTIITSLPNSIGNAIHLSSFDLSHTPITKLPSSIGELMQLEFLSLSSCGNLEELPESIGNLTSLHNLDISGTNIVEIPDSIKNLKRLKVMKMQNCQIRRLPAGIGMLERLEELDAQGCQQLVGELPTEIDGLSSLRILDVSLTDVSAVPTAINSLTRLQKLDLRCCNQLQELPKLPPSLNCLLVESSSLLVVPDLNNLTNLVELRLACGLGTKPAQASNPMQTLNLQGLGKLSDMDSLDSIIVRPQFTGFKNLSKLCLQRCPLKEIELDGLELLRDLAVDCCDFLEGLSIVSSSMRKLSAVRVFGCPKLLEIRFLGAMESLERVHVIGCRSLGGLYGLSNVKKLKHLYFLDCYGLRVVEGLEDLELLKGLSFVDCGSLEISNVSNLNIPNECWISVEYCSKLLTTGHVVSYGNYREMILGKMTRTINKEDELEKGSEIKTRTASKDSETFTKEDEIEKDSENKTRRTASKVPILQRIRKPLCFFK